MFDHCAQSSGEVVDVQPIRISCHSSLRPLEIGSDGHLVGRHRQQHLADTGGQGFLDRTVSAVADDAVGVAQEGYLGDAACEHPVVRHRTERLWVVVTDRNYRTRSGEFDRAYRRREDVVTMNEERAERDDDERSITRHDRGVVVGKLLLSNEWTEIDVFGQS